MANRSGKGPINFYFLSTGFCGTRFYYHALRLATNAEVWHQPGHDDIAQIVHLMEKRFGNELERFLTTTIAEFPRLQRRMDKRLSLPWIYGDTLNWMRGLGWMLYRYIGPERLRLVQLVRHPVATCRSMMADARQSAPAEASDITLAETLATRWVFQYVNPCGGPISFWLRAEGALVPLAEGGTDTPAQRLFEYFLRRKNKEFMNRIRIQDADFIDSVLADNGMDYITVDRSRVGEKWELAEWRSWTWEKLGGAPWEAWVPVHINPSTYSTIRGILSGYQYVKGILVWENSN